MPPPEGSQTYYLLSKSWDQYKRSKYFASLLLKIRLLGLFPGSSFFLFFDISSITHFHSGAAVSCFSNAVGVSLDSTVAKSFLTVAHLAQNSSEFLWNLFVLWVAVYYTDKEAK